MMESSLGSKVTRYALRKGSPSSAVQFLPPSWLSHRPASGASREVVSDQGLLRWKDAREGGGRLGVHCQTRGSDGRRTEFFVFFVSLVYTIRMHPLFKKADELSHLAIGAAIEVHRLKGPGLIESIYERCLMRELDLRKIAADNQRV